jgi:S1-C subfamily serine protease
MRCPKCDNEQNNAVECAKCGLIFARYKKVQERKKAEALQQESVVKKTGIGTKVLQIVLLMMVVAGTTYYFTVNHSSENIVKTVTKSQQRQTTTPAPVPEKSAVKALQKQTVSARTKYRGNPIERARNATVSIETPWGTGSGFFVNKNYIVTNRHVVQFDEQKLDEFRTKVETMRKMIQLEKKKIGDFQRRYRNLRKGPTRSQVALIIDARQGELNKVLPQQKKLEEKLTQLERGVSPSDIKIIFADGSAQVANYLLVSQHHDLALMSLFSGDWTYIEKPPKNSRIRQGDKVFAIGSPVGLRHSVTSGIISGFLKQTDGGEVYLQTDAAINPGNSGGPLIDENGYVRGVTTMILKNTEGIGFAIPIQVVFDEFSGTLY